MKNENEATFESLYKKRFLIQGGDWGYQGFKSNHDDRVSFNL